MANYIERCGGGAGLGETGGWNSPPTAA